MTKKLILRFAAALGAVGLLAAIAAGVAWWNFRPPPPPEIFAYDDRSEGLSPEEIQNLRHFHQGSPLIWLGLLKSLKSYDSDQTIYGDLERFGFLLENPDPDVNPHGLPVGFAVEMVPGMKPELPHISMSCTVCHTGEIHYGDTRMRIDGAPNLVDAEAWIVHVDKSLMEALSDPWAALSLFAGVSDYALDEPMMHGELPPISPIEREGFQKLMTLREKTQVESAMSAASQASAAPLMPGFGNQTTAKSGQALVVDAIEDELRDLLGQANEESSMSDKLGGGFSARNYPSAVRQQRDDLLKDVRGPFAAFLEFFQNRQRFNEEVKAAMSLAVDVGPGRDDPWGLVRRLLLGDDVPLTSPVSIPPLFNMEHWKYAHADGNSSDLLDRNLAQGLALGGALDAEGAASIDPEALQRAAKLFERVEAPAWPADVFGELDEDLVARGKEIFYTETYETSIGAKSCADCHSNIEGEIYDLAVVQTDPKRLNDFRDDLPMGKDLVERLNARTREIKQATLTKRGLTVEDLYSEGGLADAWHTSKGYVARTLEGIWCSPPYLHNGSVRSLAELLEPPSRRQDFSIGSRQFDPVNVGYIDDPSPDAYRVDVHKPGNSALGHAFGTELSAADKLALLEYLKSL